MLVGYARVSTEDQNLDLQTDALTSAGCEQLFTDQISGATKSRPGMDEAQKYIRPGDTLVVWKLDRLGRTVKGLVDLVESLQARDVQFRSLTDGIDTSTSAGRFFFHVMAALVQMERELIRERTSAGLTAARARGRMGGRKAKMDESKAKSAKHLLDSGVLAKEVAKNLGLSRATLYRSLSLRQRSPKMETIATPTAASPTYEFEHVCETVEKISPSPRPTTRHKELQVMARGYNLSKTELS